MSTRITRHLAPLYLPEPSEATIRQIGDSIIGNFLSGKFAPEVAFGLIKPIVISTIEVLNTAVASLLPTPSKMHYMFSLRDVKRVFQVCPFKEVVFPPRWLTASDCVDFGARWGLSTPNHVSSDIQAEYIRGLKKNCWLSDCAQIG
jgi:hypothetical protein